MNKGYYPYILFIIMIWINLLLRLFGDDSTFNVSLYVGLCFFIVIVFFNNKTYKHKEGT